MATLKTKATLDRSDFESGLDSMKRATKSFDESLGRTGGMLAGVFGGNLLSGMVEKAFDGLKEKIADVSALAVEAKNLHMPTTELEEWINLFEKFGGSKEDVVTLFDRVEAARKKAVAGNVELRKSFADLGVTMKDLTNLSAEQLNLLFAHGVGRGGSEAAAEAIGGRGIKKSSSQEALGAFARGDRANIYGMEAGSAEALNEARKASSRFWKSTGNYFAEGAGTLVTIFGDYLPSLFTGKVSKSEMRWNEANRAPKIEAEKRERERIEGEAKNAEYLKSVEDERVRHEFAQAKIHNDEIERGVRTEPLHVDSFWKKGLIAGGGAENFEALALARRQTEVAYRQTVATQNLTETMKETNLHMQAMKRINAAKPIGISGNSEANANLSENGEQ